MLSSTTLRQRQTQKNRSTARRLSAKRFSSTSDYTGLDNIRFWGVIQTPRSAKERFLFIRAIFTPRRLGCKSRLSEVVQLAAAQTPVLSSPSSAPGWAVTVRHLSDIEPIRGGCVKITHPSEPGFGSKPPRGYPEATLRPSGSQPVGTQKLPSGSPQATPRLHPSHLKAIPKTAITLPVERLIERNRIFPIGLLALAGRRALAQPFQGSKAHAPSAIFMAEGRGL